ncbi:MAG: radical SAM protein [Microthrixaceae bacterium]|nr:radical SAM protein [Microthrixaceae bacterium]
MARKYLVRTFGCQMNEHDSERIAGLLEADGMEAVTDAEQADVVVLNTCCVRENADNKLYGTLGHLKSIKDRNPDLEIVVAGCLSQKDRGEIAERASYVNVVMGTHNVHRAVDLLNESRARGGDPVVEILEETVAEDRDLFPSALPVVRNSGYAGWVTVQMGCDNNCAFCIVPAVRGPEISRPFVDIVREVQAASEQGVTEVTLLGQNVNSYGRDLTLHARSLTEDSDGERGSIDDLSELVGPLWAQPDADGSGRVRPLFADLLRALGEIPGIRRIRFTSPHPKDFRTETIAAMAQVPSVCEHLHLPLQSGSDTILAAMHRGYTAERYLERLAATRAAIPDLAVSTDIIVGFPGETDADADATLQVAAEARYDSAYTFIYSPRPGTEASTMTDKFVDHSKSVERMEKLRQVVERSSLLANQARIGMTEEILVIGPSKRDPDKLSGRTRQNRLVHFTASEPLRAGTYANAVITSATTTSLLGELTDVVAVPTHKTRIAVTAG